MNPIAEYISNLRIKRIMSQVLLFQMTLNVLDLLFTVAWFDQGFVEANPFLYRVSKSIPLFISVKLTLTTWAAIIFWFYREKLFARGAAYFSLFVYFVLSVVHVIMVFLFYWLHLYAILLFFKG